MVFDTILAAVVIWAISQLWLKREPEIAHYLVIVISGIVLIGSDICVFLAPRPMATIGTVLTIFNYILPLVMCWAFYQIWRKSESESR